MATRKSKQEANENVQVETNDITPATEVGVSVDVSEVNTTADTNAVEPAVSEISKSTVSVPTGPVIEVEMLRGEFYLEHATDGSAGFDVRAAISEPIRLHRGGRSQLIGTGFKIHINDPSLMAIIVPRSGNGHKRGLVLGNSVAIIDSDYQGEWFVSAWARPNRTQWTSTTENDFVENDTPEYVQINPGDRIAQIIFVPVIHPTFKIVDSLSASTSRGNGGFSSTGTK